MIVVLVQPRYAANSRRTKRMLDKTCGRTNKGPHFSGDGNDVFPILVGTNQWHISQIVLFYVSLLLMLREHFVRKNSSRFNARIAFQCTSTFNKISRSGLITPSQCSVIYTHFDFSNLLSPGSTTYAGTALQNRNSQFPL